MKKIVLSLLASLSINLVTADMMNGNTGGCGMIYGMYGGYGGNMMLFSWLTHIFLSF